MPQLFATSSIRARLVTIFVLALLLGVSVSSASGQTTTSGSSPAGTASGAQATLDRQVRLSNVDPSGNGISTFSIFYHLPQQAQVGADLTVPLKLYVDNLTGLKSFLQDYTVEVSMTLGNGNIVSGHVGVNSTQAAENLGAGQLHSGQEWGPVNLTIPLTQTKTGLGPGLEALGNATLQLTTDVWFNQPINFYRTEVSQANIGYIAVANGTPSGSAFNYPGLALAALGVVLLVVSFAIGSAKRSSPRAASDSGRNKPPQKAPGSV